MTRPLGVGVPSLGPPVTGFQRHFTPAAATKETGQDFRYGRRAAEGRAGAWEVAAVAAMHRARPAGRLSVPGVHRASGRGRPRRAAPGVQRAGPAPFRGCSAAGAWRRRSPLRPCGPGRAWQVGV